MTSESTAPMASASSTPPIREKPSPADSSFNSKVDLSSLSPPTLDSDIPSLPAETPAIPSSPLSQRKKWSLLALFSLGVFIDTWCFAAFFVFTGPISDDLNIVFEQSTWVINSYACPFAAFLLFWGRVADIYAAKPVFSYGFIAFGLLSLANSFLPEKFSFFVIRAMSGVAGAALIPAAYRLIVIVFEPHELGLAFTTYGLSGAIANATGLVAAGFVQAIPGSGQWRWFFRILAAVVLPFAIGSLYWIPAPAPHPHPISDKWKRLDLVGSISMLLSILFLIIGLTLGATDGWATAQFLVPFLLSFAILPFFIWWEARLPSDFAILPPSVWRIPNFSIFNVLALYYYLWWSCQFLGFIEVFVRVNGDSHIIAGTRMLATGTASGIITVLIVLYPQLVSRPRWSITIGITAGLVGYTLFILSTGGKGDRYWKFVVPGCLVGSTGNMLALTTTNVGIMTSIPPEMAGVAGAVFQVALQIGSIVGLSIQAGLLTVQEGGLGNWANVRAGYLFVMGTGAVWAVLFLVFYKPGKLSDREAETGIDGEGGGERQR